MGTGEEKCNRRCIETNDLPDIEKDACCDYTELGGARGASHEEKKKPPCVLKKPGTLNNKHKVIEKEKPLGSGNGKDWGLARLYEKEKKKKKRKNGLQVTLTTQSEIVHSDSGGPNTSSWGVCKAKTEQTAHLGGGFAGKITKR